MYELTNKSICTNMYNQYNQYNRRLCIVFVQENDNSSIMLSCPLRLNSNFLEEQ